MVNWVKQRLGRNLPKDQPPFFLMKRPPKPTWACEIISAILRFTSCSLKTSTDPPSSFSQDTYLSPLPPTPTPRISTMSSPLYPPPATSFEVLRIQIHINPIPQETPPPPPPHVTPIPPSLSIPAGSTQMTDIPVYPPLFRKI